jgi:polar amino acid transport system substrate-binding protein
MEADMLKKDIFRLTARNVTALVLLLLLIPAPGWATGPRAAPGLFAPESDEIFAVDFPPFVSTETAGGGLHVEIVDAALRAGGVKAMVTTVPLPRMVAYYLTREQAIAVLGSFVNVSEEAKKELIYIPISVLNESFFYTRPGRKDPLHWNGKLENLKGLTYGSYEGENTEAFRSAGIAVKQISPRFFLKELLAKKVDFVRMPVMNAEWQIDKDYPNEKKNLVPMEPPAGEAPVYIIFNKKHPRGEQASRGFRKGLAKIIADGSYMEILTKYMESEERREHMEKLKIEN